MAQSGLKPAIYNEDTYLVPSQSIKNANYRVTVKKNGWFRCTCPDHKNGHLCKHILFLTAWLRGNPTDYTMKPKKKKTYSQDWAAYNKAQCQEIEVFDRLLNELVSTIEEPEQTGRGRPRLPLKDMLFCSIQKVYSQLSSRRVHKLFERAEGREQLVHTPHFNVVSKALLREDLTPILRHLVRLSAAPLAGVETKFAIDSSGFRTTCFGSFCQEKHGKTKHNIWLKAHICSGVRTNVVTDVIITEGTGADCPQFEPLVLGTAERFEIDELSADKAYLSRDNYTLIGKLGGQAFIPFKINSTGRAGGSPFWKKAFHFFQFHREKFDEHYHPRSNVESTIGAIKMKFGETLKSKKFTAQVNELLCKILAYNITVLIKAFFVADLKISDLTLKSAA